MGSARASPVFSTLLSPMIKQAYRGGWSSQGQISQRKSQNLNTGPLDFPKVWHPSNVRPPFLLFKCHTRVRSFLWFKIKLGVNVKHEECSSEGFILFVEVGSVHLNSVHSIAKGSKARVLKTSKWTGIPEGQQHLCICPECWVWAPCFPQAPILWSFGGFSLLFFSLCDTSALAPRTEEELYPVN